MGKSVALRQLLGRVCRKRGNCHDSDLPRLVYGSFQDEDKTLTKPSTLHLALYKLINDPKSVGFNALDKNLDESENKQALLKALKKGQKFLIF